MLVCNISQRPPRRAVAADLTEAATAVDATATGLLVLATLVDDPAAVKDIVDAYLGEIMLEAVSAGEALDAGLAYVTGIDETVTAIDAQDGTVSGAVPTKQAMIPGAFINTDTSREAYVVGVMINQ